VGEVPKEWVPLAGIAAVGEAPDEMDLPIAYIPRIPEGRSFREMIERAVAWGRR
jgi:hypothetical protein